MGGSCRFSVDDRDDSGKRAISKVESGKKKKNYSERKWHSCREA